MKRILIWGLGEDFLKLHPYFLRAEKLGWINIIAFIDKNSKNINCKRIIDQWQINNLDFDFIVISSSRYFYEICDELIAMGIRETKIIDGRIFSEQKFDFYQYYLKGWLQDRIVNNYFEDITYLDRIRTYKGKNICIKLGRKSYVAGSVIENGGINVQTEILIGNYTSIAWDICWELDLNLDHNYSRVFNYGLSHFDWVNEDSGSENKKQILIGSDVWIGKGCKIKTGVTIGNGAVIAANSVVVKDVPPFTIYGGNPAKFIKYRFEKDVIDKLEKIKWWNWESSRIKENFQSFFYPEIFIKKFFIE